MATKQFSAKCRACGKPGVAYISNEDFIAQNRFTGEWEHMDESSGKIECFHTKNHQQNAGYHNVTWQEWCQA